MSREYDVVVVGAGPGGAVCSYELARRGVKVLLLEKEKLPRYKTCAGGVTVRAAKLLDFDLSPVTEQTAYGVRISYKLRGEYRKHYPQPLVLLVMRDRFDYFLMEKARQKGAIVRDGEEALELREERSAVTVVTASDTFVSQVVVGADGAYSRVARAAGLQRKSAPMVAIEAEVKVPAESLVSWDSLIGLDFGHIRGGYGWVFPKKEHLSIGAAGPFSQARKLKTYYQQLLTWLKLDNGNPLLFRGCAIPLLEPGMKLQQGRILLIGDAAGLVNSLSGEGIFYAIRSAQLAALTIIDFLDGKAPDLGDYTRAIEGELLPELVSSRRVARLLEPLSRFYIPWLKREERLWQMACELIRGEKTAVNTKKGQSV